MRAFAAALLLLARPAGSFMSSVPTTPALMRTRGQPAEVATRPSSDKTANEAQEFNLNVGSAIDTLRSDIPSLLHKAPDLSIFRDDVRVFDPNGEKLRGIAQYSQMYRVLRGMSSIALQDSSKIDARFFFDKSRSTLRSKVSAKLWIHGMPASAEPMHIDVVSSYEFDSKGIVMKHTVDRVDIDGTRTEPFKFMHADHAQLRGWLAGPSLQPMPATNDGRWLLPRNGVAGGDIRGAENLGRAVVPFAPKTVLSAEEQKFDVYGNIIPPSMQEKTDGATAAPKMVEKKKPGFWDFIKQFEPETCEDDFDCPSAQHCCDFIVAKTCCSGGIGVSNASPALQYIPSRINDGYGPPQDGGSGYPPGSGPTGGSPWH
mmetsp:Transcript_38621/g.88962  ORF Transcript_38621/g.88962 Transcript_38621/m.88962 type:complete len:372 (-) Transcript_38621:118-1233(-)